MDMKLQKSIESYRKVRGMSYDELAKVMGVKWGGLYAFLHNDNPRKSSVEKYRKLFKGLFPVEIPKSEWYAVSNTSVSFPAKKKARKFKKAKKVSRSEELIPGFRVDENNYVVPSQKSEDKKEFAVYKGKIYEVKVLDTVSLPEFGWFNPFSYSTHKTVRIGDEVLDLSDVFETREEAVQCLAEQNSRRIKELEDKMAKHERYFLSVAGWVVLVALILFFVI